jgi:hypothetical protein
MVDQDDERPGGAGSTMLPTWADMPGLKWKL